LLHSNVPSHNAATVKQILATRKADVLHHPPYSPHLAQSTILSYPKFKFALKSQKFHSTIDIQDVVTGELTAFQKLPRVDKKIT